MFVIAIFIPSFSYAQLGDWQMREIEESYGSTIYINSLSNKTRINAAEQTLIERKPGKYKKFKFDVDYYNDEVRSKQIASYLDGMYLVLGECNVRDTSYVRLQTLDTKTVFLIPKDFVTYNLIEHCLLPHKIVAAINDSLVQYKFIEKHSYDSVLGITWYIKNDKEISIYKPYHRTGDKEYVGFGIKDIQTDKASVTLKGNKENVYFKNPIYTLHELEKLINGHALLTDEEMNRVIREDARLLDSARALFSPKDNIKGGSSTYHERFKNNLVHLVGQEIMYCGYLDSYTPGDIYTVDSVLSYEHYYDPVRLYISNQKTGKVQILSGKEDELNNNWSVVKHIEYLRDSLVGRVYIYNYEKDSYGAPIKQVGSNKPMKDVPSKSVWICVDVSPQLQIGDRVFYFASPVIILQNEKYGQGYCFQQVKWPKEKEEPVFGYRMTDKQEYDAKTKAEQKAKQERINRLTAKYGKYYAKLIAEEKVVPGMTKEMCRESWGEPDDINVSIGTWGRHEQWVYGETYSSYLYFENGKLTTIQN